MTVPSRRPAVPFLALGAAATLTIVAAACAATSPAEDPTCPSHSTDGFRQTDGKMLAFGIAPKTIQYHFIDVRRDAEVSGVDTFKVDWDTTQVYPGVACLRFQTTDSVHINASGRFQFIVSGTNGAYARQHRHFYGTNSAVDDSVVTYVFKSGCDGTGGTYVRNADSTIALTWSDGTSSLTLSSSAIHQLVADTLIWSSVAVSTHADSLRGSWRFAWRRMYCGEGFH